MEFQNWKKFINNKFLLVIITIIVLIVILAAIYYNKNKNFKINNDYKILISETKNCTDDIKLYYSIYGGRKVYTYCLNNINIHYNNKKISLKKALKNDNINMTQIIDDLTYINGYWDGGSAVYKDDAKIISDGNITVIRCNTVDGNTNYYIGNKSMSFDQGFCSLNK